MSIETTQGLRDLRIADASPRPVRDDDNDDTTEAGLQSAYFTTLQQQAESQLESVFNISMVPVSQAGVGGFNYWWQVGNNFNPATIGYVNSRVAPAQAPAVGLNAAFGSDYDALLQTITFQYSRADQEAINQAASRASAQATAIESQYQSTYGTIDEAMMKAVGVATPIDYIIDYVVAQVWSGTQAADEPPLSLQLLQGARNLGALLPRTPSSGASLLPLIANYLNITSSALPLVQLGTNANWLLRQLITNTEQPSASNGGITLAPDGAFFVGYEIGAAVSAIVNDLEGTSSLSVTLSTSHAAGATLEASMAGSERFSVAEGWFLGLREAAGGSEDLYSFQGTGSVASITLTFTGLTYVPVQPATFDSTTKLGWFSSSVLSQANENTGKDVTGYVFVQRPQWNLASGGDFGMLTGVVISNIPTISIDYEQGDYGQFSQGFQEGSSWNVDFLGTPLSSFSQGSYVATSQASGTSGGFTLTFAPSPALLGVADLDKQAYVIGASVTYPAAGD